MLYRILCVLTLLCTLVEVPLGADHHRRKRRGRRITIPITVEVTAGVAPYKKKGRGKKKPAPVQRTTLPLTAATRRVQKHEAAIQSSVQRIERLEQKVAQLGSSFAKLPATTPGQDAATAAELLALAKASDAALARAQAGQPVAEDPLVTQIKQQIISLEYELDKQKRAATGYQKSQGESSRELARLTAALHAYIESEKRLIKTYDAYQEIFSSSIPYSREEVATLKDEVRKSWEMYTSSIDTLNKVLRGLGMEDQQVEPNQVYQLMVQGHDIVGGSSSELGE